MKEFCQLIEGKRHWFSENRDGLEVKIVDGEPWATVEIENGDEYSRSVILLSPDDLRGVAEDLLEAAKLIEGWTP